MQPARFENTSALIDWANKFSQQQLIAPLSSHKGSLNSHIGNVSRYLFIKAGVEAQKVIE